MFILVSCQEQLDIEHNTGENSVELRETPSIGIMHNNILTTYFAEFGTELDSILYFNSRQDTLLNRLVRISKQLGLDVDDNTVISLYDIIDDMFRPYMPNLNAEENYDRLVKYQYEKLKEKDLIDENVVTFIYSLTMNPASVGEVSDMINKFISENSLGNTEKEALSVYFDIYSNSYNLWTEGSGSTPTAHAFSWTVAGADAWGGFVGGFFGTVLGAPAGPIGSIFGSGIVGGVTSTYMSYLVERSLNGNN